MPSQVLDTWLPIWPLTELSGVGQAISLQFPHLKWRQFSYCILGSLLELAEIIHINHVA